MHPTSLPGRFGIGDLGPEAYRFVDFLAEAGQKVWQMLPLGPTGQGNSPYEIVSAFAGNPLLISPERLLERGYLAEVDLAQIPIFPETRVEFGDVRALKRHLLRKAFAGFTETAEYRRFEEANHPWLEPFACFMALKETNGGEPWTRWKPAKEARPEEIRFQKFLQFLFFNQWQDLKQYCGSHRIRIFGDLPFYVEHDSADVWGNRELFNLDPQGKPASVGGVPPDYFSATGQRWGNPTYRWDQLAQSGYRWWIERARSVLNMVDMVRLDHFRGYEAYWAVQANQPTAAKGRWVPGPGAMLFEAAQTELGTLPFVAEDLGYITREVEVLRERLSFPGMKVLQFGFGRDQGSRIYLPHNYPHHVVAYTGTHDNDTAVGWWTRRKGELARKDPELRNERQRAEIYLSSDGTEIHRAFIRAVMASVADTVIIPLQDILGLSSEARMNRPGTATGNWGWRYRPDALSSQLGNRLRALTELCDR